MIQTQEVRSRSCGICLPLFALGSFFGDLGHLYVIGSFMAGAVWYPGMPGVAWRYPGQGGTRLL